MAETLLRWREELVLAGWDGSPDPAASQRIRDLAEVEGLLPPEEVQEVLIRGRAAPLRTEDTTKISEMIESGFKAWNDFHDRFF